MDDVVELCKCKTGIPIIDGPFFEVAAEPGDGDPFDPALHVAYSIERCPHYETCGKPRNELNAYLEDTSRFMGMVYSDRAGDFVWRR